MKYNNINSQNYKKSFFNRILRFLFGWFYDFDAEDNENPEMTDKESRYVDKHFNDIPIFKKKLER